MDFLISSVKCECTSLFYFIFAIFLCICIVIMLVIVPSFACKNPRTTKRPGAGGIRQRQLTRNGRIVIIQNSFFVSFFGMLLVWIFCLLSWRFALAYQTWISPEDNYFLQLWKEMRNCTVRVHPWTSVKLTFGCMRNSERIAECLETSWTESGDLRSYIVRA